VRNSEHKEKQKVTRTARRPHLTNPDARYRAFIEGSADGFVLCNDQGRILEVNQAYVRASGYTRDELMAMHIQDLEARENAAETTAHIERIRREGSEVFETFHRSKDGTVWPVEVSCAYAPLEGGLLYSHLRDIRHRKKAEEAVRLSERRLSLAMQATNQGWFDMNVQTGEVHVSPEYTRILGYEPAEFSSSFDTWLDNVHPEDQEAVKGVFLECLKSGETQIMDYRRRHKSGNWVWLRSIGKVVEYDTQGKPVRMTGTNIDISEAKQKEEQLVASYQRFEAVFNLVPDPTTITDVNTGEIIDLNEAAAQWFGLSRQEAMGRTTADVFVWENPGDRDRMVREMKAMGRVDDMTFRLRHHSGEVRNVLFSSRFIELNGRQVLLSRAHDITPIKSAEIRLHESEKKYRELVENANSIILMWDAEGRVTFFNRFAQRFFGFTEEEILGKHVVGTIVPETESVTGRDLGHLMREICDDPDRFQDNENENITRDGRRVWVRWRNRAILDHEGQPVGVLSLGIDETSRKRAEEALRESEAMLRQSQSVARVAHYVFNIPAENWSSSEVLDEVFGIDPEYSHTVEGWLEIVHPDQRKEMLDYFTTQVLRDGKPFDRTYRIVRVSDGSPRWVHGLGNLEFDNDGRPVRMFGTIQDITERRNIEDALRESENRLNVILNSVDAYIFIKDLDYRYTYVNRKVCELFNLPKNEILGKGDEAFFSEASVKEVRLSDTPVIERGEIIAREERSLTGPDSRLRAYWVVKVPLRDDSGQITGLCGISTDITDVKNAEEAVRESEARFRQIAETINEVFWVGSPDWNQVHYVSPAYEQVWGRSCASLYAEPLSWLDAVHPEDREAVVEAVAIKSRGGKFGPGFPDYRVMRPDGSTRWIQARVFPVMDEGGNVTRVIGVARDVTERHLLEDERLKVQKLEAIGTLAGGIAHDFNNLLQGVFGYISIAKLSENEPQKVSRMLDEAERALSLSVNLTNQLLTFAKGGKPVKKKTALGPVIENAVKFALSGSRCEHRLKLAPDLWPADVDEGQISQVIQNITLNASEAMPAGGTIEVLAENMDLLRNIHPAFPDGGKYVRIAIKDSGIGIPEGYLSRIFDPYFTTKQKGSGLGLASAYSIVKNHSGTIEARSEHNTGTCFYVFLPASPATLPKTGPSGTPDRGTQRKGRILLMDDEEMIRNVGRNMVDALGHELVLASHGDEAVDRYREAMTAGRPFDLVILDLTVKAGMGGEETLRRLLKIDPKVTAVVSSGYSDDPILSDYQAFGFSALLNKPYSIRDLKECLDKHLA